MVCQLCVRHSNTCHDADLEEMGKESIQQGLASSEKAYTTRTVIAGKCVYVYVCVCVCVCV
jgi:hypothetical protein